MSEGSGIKVFRPNGWEVRSKAQKAWLDSIGVVDFLLGGGSAGSLKGLESTTYIPTPTGSTTMGEIQVGDEVFDDQGAICRVTATSEIHNKPCYELEFDNHEKIIADEDHLWATMTNKDRLKVLRQTDEWRAARRQKRPATGNPTPKQLANLHRMSERNNHPPVRPSVHTTKTLFETQLRWGHTNHSIEVTLPVQPPEADLLIDPYVLGAWLGDGSKDGGGFAGIDLEIIEEIQHAGYEINLIGKSKKDWYIRKIVTQLKQLGVHRNKHIPVQYMRASFDQRLALLQGLMDTDGSAPSGRGLIFYNSNYNLIKQARELIHSLGIKASVSTWTARCNGKDYGPTYGVAFSTRLPVFRLWRKMEAKNLGERPTNRRHYIVAVRPVGSVPTRCIVVDSPSHMFLVSRSFIPTHNTSTMLLDAVQELDNPNLNALVIRETHKAIKKDIELQAYEMYSQTGGKYNATELVWSWPWGARVQFGYLEQPKDVYQYYGTSLSFLGVDESTFHLEEPIRHLMTMRLRSKDPSLKVRTRLGTNPGQRGADWHMGIFMGPHCTHCYLSDQSRVPYRIYRDAVWPSDGKLIVGSDGVTAQSTCFIPSWVTEHNLYGEKGGGYAARLVGLPDRLKKALLAGCWASFEGQYFDCFDIKTMTTTYQQLLHAEDEDERLHYYAPYWTACDFGFGGSQTAAHLYTKSPKGVTYTIDEVVLKHADAPTVAEYLKSRWVGRTMVDKWGTVHPINIIGWFLSPDAWQSRGMRSGDGHTLADQMISTSGIPFEPASNDRMGGAMLMYSMLQRGQWLICSDTCPETVKSLQTRVHDPERPGDVLKIKVGDRLDDVYDSCRYGIYSFVRNPRKPREVLIEEAMTSTDITGKMMQRAMLEAKFKKIPTTISYRGARGHRVN